MLSQFWEDCDTSSCALMNLGLEWKDPWPPNRPELPDEWREALAYLYLTHHTEPAYHS